MAVRGFDVGGMFQRSGGRIGANIGAGAAAMGQGLEGLLTGVRTGLKERGARLDAESAQQQFQQILGAYQNDPAGMRTEAQSMIASRNPNLQRIGQLLMNEADRIEGVQTKAKEEKVAATTGRGKGELMALANNPKFDIMNQKAQNGYLGMANAFGVSREDAMRIALDARENRKGKDGDFRKTGEITIRDEEGNEFIQFSIQNIKNPDSAPITKTIPVGDAPDKPVGNTQIISGTTGASAFDKPEIQGEVTTAQEFSKVRVQAAEEIPTLVSQKNDIELAIESLDQISTAGIPAQVENYLRSATGGQDPNVANYELLVGEAMFARLKPLFGGVISEGERQAIVSLYSNLKRGNPANRSILQQMKRKLDETIEKGNLIRSSENFDEYNLKLDKFFPESSEQDDTNTIDYSSLPQG